MGGLYFCALADAVAWRGGERCLNVFVARDNWHQLIHRKRLAGVILAALTDPRAYGFIGRRR